MKFRLTSIFDGQIVGTKFVEADDLESLEEIVAEITHLRVLQVEDPVDVTVVPTPPESAQAMFTKKPGRAIQ